jgi:hypothetical protein
VSIVSGGISVARSELCPQGIIADALGLSWAIGTIGALTFLSGVVVALLMREHRPAIGGSASN